MPRYSPTDRFFAVVLWAAAVIAGLVWFMPDRAAWSPLLDVLVCLVTAAILVNLFRHWRACAQLRRRE